MAKIKTLKQYMKRIYTRVCDKYGIDMGTARYELPAELSRYDWRDYVVHAFNDGATMTPKVWRSLDDRTQYRVMHTQRAMRDDELTHTLEDM